MTSEVTARAQALVAERLPQARGLGIALADLIDDPDAFVRILTDGLRELSDEGYEAEQQRVARGSGPVLGVRVPLLRAVARQLRAPLRDGSSSSALWLAQRLASEMPREVRLFSLVAVERSIFDDPERSWQLLRRLARGAADWIAVDSIADVFALGIALEPRRWAELEQLVYSAHRWERRLVGSTIARLPHQRVPGIRRVLRDGPALALIRSLLGDDDDQVQKSLSWALREWRAVDPEGVATTLIGEADVAARRDDGHRAWVLRDALHGERPHVAARVREALARVRRHRDAPPTSTAGAIARQFAGMGELSDRAVSEQGERMSRIGGVPGRPRVEGRA